MHGIRQRRRLVLTLDAFGTLFAPRAPINQQYAAIAKDLGMSHIDPDKLDTTFKQAFATEKKLHPNYGKNENMTNRQWWYNVMERSFAPFVTTVNPLPLNLQSQLYNHFASAKAYRLYSDVLPFFQDIRDHKQRAEAGLKKQWEWDDITVGIISNSDDRIDGVLSDFGIKIGPRFVGLSNHDLPQIQSSEDVNFMALSYHVGHSKPDRAIFDAAKAFANSLVKEQWKPEARSKTTGLGLNTETREQPYDNVYCHVGDELEADVKLEAKLGWNSVSLDRSLPIKPISRFRRLERGSDGPHSFEGYNLQTISQGLFDPTDRSTYDAVLDPAIDPISRDG